MIRSLARLRFAPCLIVAGLLPTAATVGATPADGPALGAVFFTPAQRQAITQARRPFVASAATDTAAAADGLRFDGLVRSSAGLARAFVNGREIAAAVAGQPGPGPRLDGHAVRLPEGTRLVVGQTAMPGAAPADLVPAGSVGRALPTPPNGARAQPALAAETLQLRRSGDPAAAVAAPHAAPAAPASR